MTLPTTIDTDGMCWPEQGFVIRHLSEDVGSFRRFCTILVRFLDIELP